MILLPLLAALFAPTCRAQSGGSGGGEDPVLQSVIFPANAAAASMNLLFSNPPLPILNNRPGDWKVSLQPYYFKGSMDRDDGGQHQKGDFSGTGGGVSFSKSLGETWGVHLIELGAQMTGDGFTNVASVGGATSRLLDDVESSYLMAAPLLVRQFREHEGAKWTWSFFIGPTLTKAKTTARVREFNGAAAVSDFDYSAEKTMPGPMIGFQAAVNVGENWKLNPFAMLAGSFGNVVPKATTIRTGTVGTSQVLAKMAAGQEVVFGTGGPGFGLNLTYRPWGLTVNVTAPIVSGLPVEQAGKGVKLSQFSLSYSFGRYEK